MPTYFLDLFFNFVGKEYFFRQRKYINITEIPITSSHCINEMSKRHHGRAQPKNKKEEEKKKDPATLINSLQLQHKPPPRQHRSPNSPKVVPSQKEIVHKRHRCPNKDLRFHPVESPHSQNNDFNKAIA
jgi:hypothetical protein